MMRNSGLQPQKGHSGSDQVDAAVSSWVLSKPRTEDGGAAGAELGSMILMVDVVAALHPVVKCIKERRGEFMSARAVSKYTQKSTGGVGSVLLPVFIPMTAGSSCSTTTANDGVF